MARMSENSRKNIVLCFDGTRENFGPQPITNVLRLYQMLENNDDRTQMCYYQSGIGTEADFDPVTDVRRKFTSSHFQNITDAMFASSVDHHIVAGYLFLMAHYEPGDQIFMFGFSRGAFIARALAGMIELVGLLNRGLTGMVSMAWRIYEKWEFAEQPGQPDYNSTLADEFKRTFSRGCEIRIHFQGLWDSVNSVGILRDRLFPCTQRSGIVDHVRHAVSLDERKGKFKQQSFAASPHHFNHSTTYGSLECSKRSNSTVGFSPFSSHRSEPEVERTKFNSANPSNVVLGSAPAINELTDAGLINKERDKQLNDVAIGLLNSSEPSFSKVQRTPDNVEKNKLKSSSAAVTPDLIEKWFPGDHSDVGGGWCADYATRENLSNLSMRWMIAEAVKHGVKFKQGSVHAFASKHTTLGSLFSTIHDKLSFSHGIMLGPLEAEGWWNETSDADAPLAARSVCASWLNKLLTDLRDYRRAEKLTDEEVARETYSSLCNGTNVFETFLWWILEFIPIGLRLEKEAGKWKNAYIPNLGRHRYVPLNSDLHWSIFWRIKYDERYRPTNLPAFARTLLEEHENIHLSSPTVANINTIASPLRTYPQGFEHGNDLEEINEDASTTMQALLRKEDQERIAAERTAKTHYLTTKKAFDHWEATSWREFPDDLEEILREDPSL